MEGKSSHLHHDMSVVVDIWNKDPGVSHPYYPIEFRTLISEILS